MSKKQRNAAAVHTATHMSPVVPESAKIPEPSREDQTRCPICQRFGCPAYGGSHVSDVGRKRYRRCTHCGSTHVTLQRHGSEVEEFIT